ncbi:MAG: polysaccharide deacetylase family protein [Solirubrobacterales bacterium]
MTVPPTAAPGAPGDPQAQRLAQRERLRRQIRRRRLLATAALLTGVLAIAAVILAGLGNGSTGRSDATRSKQATAGTDGAASGAPGGRVRNATPQSNWVTHTGPVPILEYHVLGSPPPEAPYPELYVGRSDFSRQMNWLDEHGYQAVTLEEVENAWYHGGMLPIKPIVLSFDDGYRPQFTFALPELRKHGWPGLLNLKAEGSDLYTSNVEAMVHAGWELAAHTIHHLDLTTLNATQLREEVAGSRAMLRREYGVPVANFCYPAGRFNETVVAAVRAAGYVGATTEIPGYATADRPYELDRLEILRSSGVAGMAAALSSHPG